MCKKALPARWKALFYMGAGLILPKEELCMEQGLMTPLRALYESYIAKGIQLERDKKPGAGLLGLTAGPKDDPCHRKFLDDLQEMLAGAQAAALPSGEVCQALAYIYRAPLEHKEPLSVYWVLQAAHGATLGLIGLLEPADARTLRDDFARMYRRWERLPAQKKVLEALEKAAE